MRLRRRDVTELVAMCVRPASFPGDCAYALHVPVLRESWWAGADGAPPFFFC